LKYIVADFVPEILRCRRYIPPKYRLTLNRMLGIISHKTYPLSMLYVHRANVSTDTYVPKGKVQLMEHSQYAVQASGYPT
jgi:hypothetical protein